MRIETENLIIRNFEMKDKDDLVEYMLQRVDAEFERYPDFTKEKGDDEIKFRTSSDEFFAIQLKENNKVVGNIYFGKRNFNSRELGYVLNCNYQRKGIGTEACKAIINYAFSKGLHRIFAECAPQNTASWKLMEKAGMKREAHFRKNVAPRKDAEGKPIYWDTYVYGILDSDN